jgi:hypothetical protein
MNARHTIFALSLLLAGCDLEALLADPKVAQKEAEAKAIGSACRHGLRSIEDCYSLNEKAPKAAIFSGWKEMDQYMRDNKIEGIEAKGLKPPSPAGISPVAPDEEIVDAAKADKTGSEGKKAAKSDSKSKAKAEH